MKTMPSIHASSTISTNRKKTIHRQGFTLLELLISMSIIAILASLAVPAVMIVLGKGKQARDFNNAKQLATILIADATDYDGRFRTNRDASDTSLSGTTLEVFQGLIDDSMLGDPTVVMAEGFTRPKRSTLEDHNIGYQYIAGYTTTSPMRLPLLITRGVGYDPADPEAEKLAPGTSAWGYDGVVVAYIGGSAEWISGKEEGGMMALSSPIGLGKPQPNATLYD